MSQSAEQTQKSLSDAISNGLSSMASGVMTAVSSQTAGSGSGSGASSAPAASTAASNRNGSSTAATTGNSGSIIGPLPTPKTITVTWAPDWNQVEMTSTLPASLCVVFGPENTLPQHAYWSFEFNVYAMDPLTGIAKKADEETIGVGSRALLWNHDKPFAKYQHCVVPSGCRLSTKDDISTTSITMRPYKGDPNSKDEKAQKFNSDLVYVRRKPGVSIHQSTGYLKVVKGHLYYFNITFAAGSTIAQLVELHKWRPMFYLSVKKPQKSNTESITGSRLFTNFVTKWAGGVELNPDERELKQAQDAQVADQIEEENAKLASSAVKSQERSGSATATAASASAEAVIPPAISFLLSDSALTGAATAVRTMSMGPLTQRSPLSYTPTASAFPPTLTGAIPLQQQQTAQILAAQYQQQQQILLQQQMQRAMALQHAASAATPTSSVAQRGGPAPTPMAAAAPAPAPAPAPINMLGITQLGRATRQTFGETAAPPVISDWRISALKMVLPGQIPANGSFNTGYAGSVKISIELNKGSEYFPNWTVSQPVRGYIEVESGTYYRVRMDKPGQFGILAKLHIDGKSRNYFVMRPTDDTWALERPSNENKGFLFTGVEQKAAKEIVAASGGSPNKTGEVELEYALTSKDVNEDKLKQEQEQAAKALAAQKLQEEMQKLKEENEKMKQQMETMRLQMEGIQAKQKLQQQREADLQKKKAEEANQAAPGPAAQNIQPGPALTYQKDAKAAAGVNGLAANDLMTDDLSTDGPGAAAAAVASNK